MLKKIKSDARRVLFKNYKFLFVPALVFMTVSFLKELTLKYFSNQLVWCDYPVFLQVFVVLLFLTLEIIAVPVTIALLYRAVIIAKNGDDRKISQLKQFINTINIKKIVLINLVPRILAVFCDGNEDNLSIFNLFDIRGISLIILSAVSTVVTLMFVAANYLFALNEGSVKETIVESFRLMKRSVFSFILLYLSFVGWILLEALIFFVIKGAVCGFTPNLVNVYTPVLDSFLSFGFGVDFYLLPYMYLSTVGLFENHQNRN